MTSTPSAHLTCLCGAISEPGTLLKDDRFPTSASICHCNSCRRTSGSLGASFPPLKSPPPEATLSRLTAYHSSDIITRYFCSKCGCHCFIFHHPRKKWYCLGGVVEPSPSPEAHNVSGPKNTIQVSLHEYVSDTLDGGLAPLFHNLGGRFIPIYTAAPGSAEIAYDTTLSSLKESVNSTPPPAVNSCLPAKCHCGGVSLLIKRANYESSTAAESARYIPSDPTKWLSYFCTCRSCRLSFGVSLTPWTLVLPAHVFNASGVVEGSSKAELVPVVFDRQAASPDANPGLTLKHYWSSPDVCRTFCGKCGASVSY
ncbi:uncharacterized protein LY89DRAFT_686187 [Mollisia scopiformis]|uniref:CENP-V/GFA domain-containing protein n=1 Tax=Mollisia scopiformis TaxID=149040 RepID=A0A194X6K4_MOLSC|nr:uncharacterized protein LY89DRAFT_686187 [Mollisia scopiformis]KUJ15432.1 hypothetical protein LY89DRAFT_686187 [Mollisia scopiformis]